MTQEQIFQLISFIQKNLIIYLENPQSPVCTEEAHYVKDDPATIHLRVDGYAGRFGVLPSKDPDKITEFSHYLSGNLYKLLLLTHEYGHHPPELEDYEDVVQRKKDSPKSVSDKEWQLVVNEEILAWDRAKSALEGFGWYEWTLFYQQREQSLLTYTDQFQN